MNHNEGSKRAWLATALAWVAVLLLGLYVEAAVRQDIRDATKVEPADWSDAQVRAYATARSRISFNVRARLLQQVVEMRPSGAITAAAASELTTFGAREDEIRYALLAVRAAPPDSPRLAFYARMAAMELESRNRAAEATALLAKSLERAALPRAKAKLLGTLLYYLDEAQGPDAMLRAYAQYQRRLPEVARADTVQETLANALDRRGRRAQAERIYRHLAANATSVHIREWARQKLLSGGNDGH